MKQTKAIILIIALLTSLSPIQSWSGSVYYKNLSITVKNPETAKGRVYLTPYNQSDTTYCTITYKPEIAKVGGNLSNNGTNFQVRMLALPADGYVLDCLTSPKAYANGKYHTEGVCKLGGLPLKNELLIIDRDTITNCSQSRPAEGEKLRPVSSIDLYAIFVPSKRASVHNSKAGLLANAVKSNNYVEATNDLVVTGPLNDEDFSYLNTLSKDKGLVRLDLSKASFTKVPDSAFYESGLYELKLPQDIKEVGDAAFAFSRGLKPVNLPSGIIKGDNTINGCTLMNLLGVKEEYVSSAYSNWMWGEFFGL